MKDKEKIEGMREEAVLRFVSNQAATKCDWLCNFVGPSLRKCNNCISALSIGQGRDRKLPSRKFCMDDWSTVWKQQDWKTRDKPVWGRGTWTDLQETAQACSYARPPEHIHHRRVSQQPVGKEDSSSCQLVFLIDCLWAGQRAQEQRSHVPETEACMGILWSSQRYISLSNLPPAETKEISQPFGSKLITTDTFHLGGTEFCPDRNWYLIEYRFMAQPRQGKEGLRFLRDEGQCRLTRTNQPRPVSSWTLNLGSSSESTNLTISIICLSLFLGYLLASIKKSKLFILAKRFSEI